MIAMGFIIAVYLVSKNPTPFGLTQEDVVDLSLYILIGGIIGARIMYILLNLDYFVKNPLEVFYLSRGGLVYYGAFAGGVVAMILGTRNKKISFLRAADLFAPYLALAQGVGRIGCFLNGCCYGREVSATFPFKVCFPGSAVARHPTQIYSSLVLVLLFLMLKSFQPRRRFSGEIFMIYCALYSFQRYFMEFLRGDNTVFMLNMTISQAVSVVLFIGSSIAWAVFFARWKNTHL